MITPEQLRRAARLTPANVSRWHAPITSAMAEFGIDTSKRQAAFLAQVGHESNSFTSLSESLYYTDARRIATIFRTGFDLDGDGVVDPEEIEFARGYVRRPEKLANRAYANRGGNGPESSGDGWRYRGRGLIQTTFKNNYRAAGNALELDLLGSPDLLLQPLPAARSAAFFWWSNNLNNYADSGDFKGLTRRINSGMLGMDDRLARLKDAEAALCPR